MDTDIPIADAMLFELKGSVILVGRNPSGSWLSPGSLTSVNFSKGTASDFEGRKYVAVWAGPEVEPPADAEAEFLKREEWRRIFRYEANEWQRKWGWSPPPLATAAQAELWEVIVVGSRFRLAGLLSGHPERRDGWGVTPALSHLALGLNFAVTQADQQRWHLGTRQGGKSSRTIDRLLAKVQSENPKEEEIYLLSQHELNEFDGKHHVWIT